MLIQVYTVLRDGKIRMVSKSKTEAEQEVKDQMLDPDCRGSSWEIVAEERDLPVVKATIIDPTDYYMHVTWNCPYTDKLITSDIEQERSGSEIWFCESSDLAIVEWSVE